MHRRELQTNVNRTCKAALSLALLAGTSALNLLAGGVTPPTTGPIAVPPGNTQFLVGNATGTQGYICLPTASGAAWGGPVPPSTAALPSRPRATLFTTLFGNFKQQILTHFLSPAPTVPPVFPMPPVGCITDAGTSGADCPTWQGSFDSSTVWGTKIGSINAGTDPSCPGTGGPAIPCLLLQAVTTQNGPNGFGILTNTTYIQRLNTTGGVAPAGSCTVGTQALVPYTADYYFYTAQQ